ncbi:hypothetical protein Afil01_51360 [Actinorhabdospora filicis]|uniref:Methyltransferase type 11 domain-containing protein n=1 Tax=Actinorhabdospora filicis TaxID=1785913 RepID=A0A9W6WB65_9ACTN|nr:class I SAM-dependent methyltransferase [Actinorhabdospora filicis]GLZ80329.1 hypothetical protein Afil01_51360 [Actinorhabdospora filicis]
MTTADLITEGLTADISGWDFSRWGDRMRTEHPWDYPAIVADLASTADSLLDLGTGGGEWLSRLLAPARPPLVVATEGWAPNVPVAAKRLRPVGVPVVWVDAAPDNVKQHKPPTAFLPFRDASFDVVNARHESYVAGEVARVLKPGGVFVTQQVHDVWIDRMARILGLTPPAPSGWERDLAVGQLRRARLYTVEGGAGTVTTWFADVAPLIWYVRLTGWVFPGFDPASGPWTEIQARIERDGPLPLREPGRWWLAAVKR